MKRVLLLALPVLALLALLFAALWLATGAEGSERRIGDAYVWLFALAASAAAVLLLGVVGEARRLLGQWRSGAAGSRLNIRLAWLMAALALPPTLLVAAFAIRFIDAGIDSWFRADVESSQQIAASIGHELQASFERRARERSRGFALALADAAGDRQQALDTLVAASPDPLHLGLYDQAGGLIALAFNTSVVVLPAAPSEAERLRVQQAGQLASSERISQTLSWRVLDRVDGVGLLQAIYPLPVDLAPRLDALERTAVDYAQLRFQRGALKSTLVLILVLVSLLALLGVLLTALAATRRLLQPVADLAAATAAIAAGRFGEQLPDGADDVLGLTGSFNRMSADLAQAERREQHSRAEIETSRAHLAAVLARLSAGVLSFDGERILTANAAAGSLLDLPAGALEQCPLDTASERFPRAAVLIDRLHQHARAADAQWREEVRLQGEPTRVLIVRGVRLPGPEPARFVAVFDDAAVLAHAQREAAWAEVARRLAHEIKNPLTPIQLAAERLRHKYLGKMASADAEVLDRATHTIVAQVDALKAIVNAFGDYAQPASGDNAPFAIGELLTEVLDLYEHSGQCAIERRLPAAPIHLRGNRERLRQALVNLLTNAIEASAGQAQPRIEGALASDASGITLSLRDHGCGLPMDFDPRWFEPYTTTKTKGTGLGLALVKKIVEEHQGSVDAAPAEGGGAIFTLHFPKPS
ncbi:MAG: PAS domain-containing sensor histidine kinase [Lysobacterales bacterium]